MPVPTCYIFAAGDPDRSARPAPGDFLIAADAGYLTMERQGLTPDLVVGDFDSMPPPDHPHLVRHPVEKDDTDAALAVEEGLKRGFRRFVLCGALGGPRLDHTLANLQLLARLSRGGCEAFLTGGGTVVFALTDGRVCFSPACSGVLSVFCHGERAAGVTERNVFYPLENRTLTGDVALGVSNQFVGAPAEISVRSGTLLLLWTGSPADIVEHARFGE